jgi:predicted hydrocarbon binding protein
MEEKGSILDWFIKNFIIPRYKDYKSPGFIVVNFKNNQGEEVFFREVLIPEDIIIEIENRFYKKYKDKGKGRLYDIGVTLGYNFMKLLGAPCLKNNTKEEVEKYLKFTFKFNFSTWCKTAEFVKLDVDKHLMEMKLNGHVVCRKNGKGFILTEGSEAGVGKYAFSNNLVETVQKTCQGRKDKYCYTITAPISSLKKQKLNPIKDKILYIIKNPLEEKKFNSIIDAKYSTTSTYEMIQNKIFKIKEGKISYEEKFLFDCSIFLYYLLENFLVQLKDGGKLLYEIGFDYGKSLAKNKDLTFVKNILSATGWGDILISKDAKDKLIVNISSFPWTPLTEKQKNFNLFCGMISGMLSSSLKREIKLKKVKKTQMKDCLKIQIS